MINLLFLNKLIDKYFGSILGLIIKILIWWIQVGWQVGWIVHWLVDLIRSTNRRLKLILRRVMSWVELTFRIVKVTSRLIFWFILLISWTRELFDLTYKTHEPDNQALLRLPNPLLTLNLCFIEMFRVYFSKKKMGEKKF